MADAELACLGRCARERMLDEHTSDHRAGQLLSLLAEIFEGMLPPYTPATKTPTKVERGLIACNGLLEAQ